MKILILLFFVSVTAMAQTTDFQPVCPVCPVIKEDRSSATNRDKSFLSIMGGYQFLNTWVPSKHTGSLTYIFNRHFSLELEYAGSKRDIAIAGIELGSIEENRYSLALKYYLANSFSISLGPYVNDLTFDLGDKIRDAAGITGNNNVEISTLGVAFGIGNRWQLDNGITLGIDWLRVNQPTGTYRVKDRILRDLNEDDKDDVKRTGRLFRTIPAFTFFGLNIGYTF